MQLIIIIILYRLDHVYNEQLFEEPETLAASHL